MSENRQVKDASSILAQFEKDWQELRRLLRLPQMESPEPQQLDFQSLKQQRNLDEGGAPLDEGLTPQLPRDQLETRKPISRGTITPMEAEAIVQGVEKVQRDAQILERLVRVEKQSRRIAILGSMFLTMLALSLGVVAFLMVQSHLVDKVALFSAAPGIIQPKSPVSDSSGQKVSAKQPETEATVKYVGSKTSNKYHYPDCKWAKMISSERLITFKSVEEAQKAGYKPCPTCKPRVAD
jgi:hypothetical protein